MEEQNKKTERLKNFFFLLFAIVINFIIAVIVYHFTDISMCVVKGSDTMYHIYRGCLLYTSDAADDIALV